MLNKYKIITATEANRNFGTVLNTANEHGGVLITKRDRSYFLLTEKEMSEVSSKCFYGKDGFASIKVSFEGDRIKIYTIDFSSDETGDYTLYDLPLNAVTLSLDRGTVTISFDYLDYQQSVSRDAREKVRMSKGSLYMDETLEDLKSHLDLSVTYEKSEYDQVVFFRNLLDELTDLDTKIKLFIKM